MACTYATELEKANKDLQEKLVQSHQVQDKLIDQIQILEDAIADAALEAAGRDLTSKIRILN